MKLMLPRSIAPFRHPTSGDAIDRVSGKRGSRSGSTAISDRPFQDESLPSLDEMKLSVSACAAGKYSAVSSPSRADLSRLVDGEQTKGTHASSDPSG